AAQYRSDARRGDGTCRARGLRAAAEHRAEGTQGAERLKHDSQSVQRFLEKTMLKKIHWCPSVRREGRTSAHSKRGRAAQLSCQTDIDRPQVRPPLSSFRYRTLPAHVNHFRPSRSPPRQPTTLPLQSTRELCS